MQSITDVYQALTTQSASGYGPTIYNGTDVPTRGFNVGIHVTAATGTPNCLFQIDTSPDGVTWRGNTLDELGLTNTAGPRNIHYVSQYPYARLAWGFFESDPGEATGNGSVGTLTFESYLQIANNG